MNCNLKNFLSFYRRKQSYCLKNFVKQITDFYKNFQMMKYKLCNEKQFLSKKTNSNPKLV